MKVMVREAKTVSRTAKIDVVKHHGDLLDAGAELLPLLHMIGSLDRTAEREYEEAARAIWKQLRRCWASWWMLNQVWDPADSWAEWERCTGKWELWKAAGFGRLVRFWLERVEPPYQITHAEMSEVSRWLYGTAYQMMDRPYDPPPFWVVEMIDRKIPGMESLVDE